MSQPHRGRVYREGGREGAIQHGEQQEVRRPWGVTHIVKRATNRPVAHKGEFIGRRTPGSSADTQPSLSFLPSFLPCLPLSRAYEVNLCCCCVQQSRKAGPPSFRMKIIFVGIPIRITARETISPNSQARTLFCLPFRPSPAKYISLFYCV